MTFLIVLIDGPLQGRRLHTQGPEDRPGQHQVIAVDGVDYNLTCTSETTVVGAQLVSTWHATHDAVNLVLWWRRLSRAARTELSENPWGCIPPVVVGEVIRVGQFVVGSHWQDALPGPDGFYLAQHVQEWINTHRVQRNNSARRCPTCAGPWLLTGFDFSHADFCDIGTDCLKRNAQDLEVRRAERRSTEAEMLLADALGMPARPGLFNPPPGGPRQLSPPHFTTLQYLPGGGVHRTIDGFDPDPMWTWQPAAVQSWTH